MRIGPGVQRHGAEPGMVALPGPSGFTGQAEGQGEARDLWLSSRDNGAIVRRFFGPGLEPRGNFRPSTDLVDDEFTNFGVRRPRRSCRDAAHRHGVADRVPRHPLRNPGADCFTTTKVVTRGLMRGHAPGRVPAGGRTRSHHGGPWRRPAGRSKQTRSTFGACKAARSSSIPRAATICCS